MILTRLPWLRARQRAWMDRSVQVVRAGERVPDGAGGWDMLPPRIVARLPAMIEVVSVFEQVGGSRVEVGSQEVIHLPRGSVVRGTDTLRLDDGREYDVTGTNDTESHATTLAVKVTRRGE